MVPWYKVQNSCIILDSPFTDQLKPNTRDGRLSELCQKVMIWQHSYDRKQAYPESSLAVVETGKIISIIYSISQKVHEWEDKFRKLPLISYPYQIFGLNHTSELELSQHVLYHHGQLVGTPSSETEYFSKNPFFIPEMKYILVSDVCRMYSMNLLCGIKQSPLDNVGLGKSCLALSQFSHLWYVALK